MIGPIELERRFQALVDSLAEPLSTGRRLVRAARLIELLLREGTAADSYLMELAAVLPAPDAPPGYYGMDPAELATAAAAVAGLADRIPGLADNVAFQAKLESYRLNLALAWVHVGRIDEACAVFTLGEVPEWITLFCTSPAGTPRQMLAAVAAEARVRQNTAAAESLGMLDRRYPPALGGLSVYLPVLERPADEGEDMHGVLRAVTLRAPGKHAGPRDQVGTNILMYGTAQTDADLLDRPLTAARAMVAESRRPRGVTSMVADVIFDRADALHQGSSSDLALAAILTCGYLRLDRTRETVGLAEDVAITGIIDDAGRVHAVDQRALVQKVSAAFHSPVQCLVVPRVQMEEAERLRNALESRFPARSLSIVGVPHVRDLFFDRRVTDRRTVSAPLHVARRVWDARRPVAGVLFVMLVALVFRLWYGPLDRNAAYYEATGNVLNLYNSSGSFIRAVEVGRGTVMTLGAQRVPGEPTERIADLIDVDGDGTNELVWMRLPDRPGEASEITCEEVVSGERRWRMPLRLGMKFLRSPDVISDLFYPRLLRSADLDADGRPEIYAIVLHEFFPSMLLQIAADSGRVLTRYCHIGHLQDVQFIDLDGDGTDEIIVTGVSNAFRQAVVAVLDHRSLEGWSPTTAAYRPEEYREARHRAYIRFPATAVGEAFRLRSEFGVGTQLSLDAAPGKIKVAIQEVAFPAEDGRGFLRGMLYAWLDLDLRFAGYSSGGLYDELYDRLASSGQIPPLDRSEYLLHHAPPPLYYAGGSWRASP